MSELWCGSGLPEHRISISAGRTPVQCVLWKLWSGNHTLPRPQPDWSMHVWTNCLNKPPSGFLRIKNLCLCSRVFEAFVILAILADRHSYHSQYVRGGVISLIPRTGTLTRKPCNREAWSASNAKSCSSCRGKAWWFRRQVRWRKRWLANSTTFLLFLFWIICVTCDNKWPEIRKQKQNKEVSSVSERIKTPACESFRKPH